MSELRTVRDKVTARRDELQDILERAGVPADESEAVDTYNEVLRIIDVALQDEADALVEEAFVRPIR